MDGRRRVGSGHEKSCHEAVKQESRLEAIQQNQKKDCLTELVFWLGKRGIDPNYAADI